MKENVRAHYVDNKEFYQKISEYKKSVLAAQEEGRDKPPVTDYLGECFIKIANHLSMKSNFINYTFRDEMVLDGIENCLTYIDNFDPEKSKNPFAYFTQITYYAFLRRIQKEKDMINKKIKYLQSIDIQSLMDEVGDNDPQTNEYLKWMQEQLDNNAREEAKHKEEQSKKKVIKRRPKYLDKRSDSNTEELDISSK